MEASIEHSERTNEQFVTQLEAKIAEFKSQESTPELDASIKKVEEKLVLVKQLVALSD